MVGKDSESVVERQSISGIGNGGKVGEGSQALRNDRRGGVVVRWRWIAVTVVLAGFFGVLFVTVSTPPAPWVVWNDSPSMETGFYGLTVEEPGHGKTVVVEIPETALRYAQERGLRVGWGGFLKPVGAVAGDEVCVSFEEGLRINGERLAEVKRQDSSGNEIAAWIHCRELTEDEFFLYAPRVANSYDSRYYGPVRGASIKGVYEALWTW